MESESEISTLTSEVKNILDTDNKSQDSVIKPQDLSKKVSPEEITETVEPGIDTAQEPENLVAQEP